jgi:outer membrane receptor protein involved in Fe transport
MLRAAMTYVTGSHTFKTGFQREHLKTDNYIISNGNVQYIFRNGQPVSICSARRRISSSNRTDDLGIFGQDHWKFGKFTFNCSVWL